MLQFSRVGQSGNYLLGLLSLVSLLGLLATTTASPIKLAPAGAALYTRSIEPSIETEGDGLISARDLGSKTPTHEPPSVWLNPKDTLQAEGIAGTTSQGPKRKREIGNLALSCPEGEKESTCVIEIPGKRSEIPNDGSQGELAKRKQATIPCCVPNGNRPVPARTPDPKPISPIHPDSPASPGDGGGPISLGPNPDGQDYEDS